MKTVFVLLAIAYLLLGWLLLHQAVRVVPVRYYVPVILSPASDQLTTI